MEELSKWVQKKEDDLKDYSYPDPPILSPVAAMDCDKISLPVDIDKQLDMPPPAELGISSPSKLIVSSSSLATERGEGKKSSPKAKQSHLKYQFQLRPCHAVKGRQKLFRCDICGGIYRHAFSLKRHFLRTHINYKYLSEADKSNCNITASAINFNHKHTNSKGLDANQWPPNDSSSKSFDNQDGKRQHDFPFLFSCYSCQEYFHQQDELKTHVDNHVPVVKRKEFRCEKCKMTFTLKKNLRRHMAIHDSGRTFNCKYCNKQFFTLASHKMHERIHEGKKSHKCSHCTASFIHYDNLKEHTQYQHGAYYHACNICLKFFGTEEQLTLHAEEHMELSLAVRLNGKVTGQNCESDSFNYGSKETTQFFDSPTNFDYTCTVCGKKFLSYVNMCRHHRLAHQPSPKKRGRPQKSKVPRPEGDCKIANNALTENSETEFYNNIADKISDNLVNFVDGKYLDLEQYCSSNSTYQIAFDTQLEVSWHSYNFPPNFDYSKVELSESESEVDSNVERNSEGLLSDSFYSGNESDTANLSNDVFDQYSDKDEDQNCEIEIGDRVACADKSIGQNIPLTYICCACVERFSSLVAIEEHKINNHPNVFCTHIEIEGDKDIPPELCQQFYSPVGIFKRYIVPSLDFQQNDGLACTKCQKIFNSVSDLHLHILECGGGSNFKTDNTNKKKGMRKKKLRQGMKFQTSSGQKKNIDDAQTTDTCEESVEILHISTLQEKEIDTQQEEIKISKTHSKPSIENFEIFTSLEKETRETLLEENNILSDKIGNSESIESNTGVVKTASECLLQKTEEQHIEKNPCKEVNIDIRQDICSGDNKENFNTLMKDRKETFEVYSSQERKNEERPDVPKQSNVQLQLNFRGEEATECPPYTCRDCKKAFNYSLTFERHNKGCRQKMFLDRNAYKTVHWNISHRTCPYCKRSFTQVTALKKHVKNSCHKKKLKWKVRKKLQNLKQMNFARLTKLKLERTSNKDHNSLEENSNIKIKDEGKINKFPQIINKNFANVINENFKICFDSEPKQSSVNTQTDVSNVEKTDSPLEAEVPLSLKQIQNSEGSQDELSFTGSNEIKHENSSSRGLFPQQRICPHCFRSFAYLANYRRHIKEVCPVKKQLAKETEGYGTKLRSPVPIFAATTCTVKGKIEDSVIGLLRDQSRQSEMMRASEPEDGGLVPAPRFRTFSCKVCHKIFLSFVKMLQHRLSHKLQSDESEDLPKLDLGLMEKLQGSSTIDPKFEQQNAQEILNNLDNYLIKASEDELERAEQNIVILSHQSETDNINHSQNVTNDNEIKANNKVTKGVHCCEVCGKSFSSSASKLKHYRIAHKKSIPKKIKTIKKNTQKVFKHSPTKSRSRSTELPLSNINRVRKFGKQRTKHREERWHKT